MLLEEPCTLQLPRNRRNLMTHQSEEDGNLHSASRALTRCRIAVLIALFATLVIAIVEHWKVICAWLAFLTQ